MKRDEQSGGSTSRSRPWSRFGLVATLMAGALLAVVLSSSGTLLATGTAAPPFDLAVVGSRDRISLESLRGKVVLVDFWSTSCPPCLRQMQDLEVVHRQMGDRGVVVLGINSEDAEPRAIDEFVRSRGVRYPVLLDDGAVAEQYRVVQLPTLYAIDREGRVRWSRVGFAPREELVEILRDLL